MPKVQSSLELLESIEESYAGIKMSGFITERTLVFEQIIRTYELKKKLFQKSVTEGEIRVELTNKQYLYVARVLIDIGNRIGDFRFLNTAAKILDKRGNKVVEGIELRGQLVKLLQNV